MCFQVLDVFDFGNRGILKFPIFKSKKGTSKVYTSLVILVKMCTSGKITSQIEGLLQCDRKRPLGYENLWMIRYFAAFSARL